MKIVPLFRGYGQPCAHLALGTLSLLASLGSMAAQPAQAETPPPARLETTADAYRLGLNGTDGQSNNLFMPYFVAKTAAPAQPISALVVMHGHPRDAGKTLAAGALAAQQAGRNSDTLIVAPLFPVGRDDDSRCHSAGVPLASAGDALWTCGSWIDGGVARSANEQGEKSSGKPTGVTSYAALDQLLADLQKRWPSLQTITVAGFSAGAQFVQHYAAFAKAPQTTNQTALQLRFVVADPGSWLYFDGERPTPLSSASSDTSTAWNACTSSTGPGACQFRFSTPDVAACPGYNDWKYGLNKLPAALNTHAAAQLRARYISADVSYLLGGDDTGDQPGTYYKILDKSCPAQLQGPYRLQRGLAYAAYDRARLAVDRPRQATVVPGCKHDVSCVFPSKAAATVLFPARQNR